MKTKKLIILLLTAASFIFFYVIFFKTDSDASLLVVSHLRYKELLNKTSPEYIDNEVVRVALKINNQYKPVLITMINDVYLPFTYSWLCNTKDMNIHKSVLIITTDKGSKEKLNKFWPEVNVVALDLDEMKGNQVYSRAGYVRLMIRRTEILMTLLNAGVEMFLFEVDCLWLTNVIPTLHADSGYDLLVNPVAERKNTYAGGFLYMWPTNKTIELWKELTKRMLSLGEKIKKFPGNKYVVESENDQIYFSALVTEKFGGIKIKVLPLQDYADGKWYSLPDKERMASRPQVINNNWVEGNAKKIDRAKKWGHWFIKEDNSCDMNQVNKVLKEYSPKILA
ncbi:hypothetical protein CHS0354_003023 [Potamilus streckersoni]|uniref:Nucleotide-diphospho-sugar transferase domain-containing protein n=1 Tax=Potamilus streckersoni TaxID=2493646 RepID=A0AAE0W4S6_9BIVA|nr:hypothetical protein CHS0354_003023 [Potamilus streckersoni]